MLASRFNGEQLAQNELMDPQLARLWVDAVPIPPLDDHIEDIPELLEYYVNWYSDNEQLTLSPF